MNFSFSTSCACLTNPFYCGLILRSHSRGRSHMPACSKDVYFYHKKFGEDARRWRSLCKMLGKAGNHYRGTQNVGPVYTRCRLQVRDLLSKRTFLVDIGVELSLLSFSAIDRAKMPDLILLKAANVTLIALYSNKTLILSLAS